MKGHPNLTAIGDWVIVALKDDSSPIGICETPTRIETCEVIGIVEKDGRLFVHLAGENNERFKVGYYNLHQIDISDESLQDFGFEPCDGDKVKAGNTEFRVRGIEKWQYSKAVGLLLSPNDRVPANFKICDEIVLKKIE